MSPAIMETIVALRREATSNRDAGLRVLLRDAASQMERMSKELDETRQKMWDNIAEDR